MSIKIAAVGAGLAAILGAGSILLAAIGKDVWPIFLLLAFMVFLIGKLATIRF